MLAHKIAGRHLEMLIDKLGERLAFERAGVRLYQAFIAKLEAIDKGPQKAWLETAWHFCEEEKAHFELVSEALEKIGADPTAQTPCADALDVASAGAIKLIQDPRSNIAQSLNALLGVELIDNAGWELLIQLAQLSKQEHMIESFKTALKSEQDHLNTVKNWLEHEVLTPQA